MSRGACGCLDFFKGSFKPEDPYGPKRDMEWAEDTVVHLKGGNKRVGHVIASVGALSLLYIWQSHALMNEVL